MPGTSKRRRRWLGAAIGIVALLWIVYYLGESAAWRHFDLDRLTGLLVHARPVWLLGALAGTCLSYVIRAYRWKFFLDPLKRASVWILFKAQIFGFSSIYLFGRPGEVVRPAYIARREGVSFTSQIAILVLERIYDTIALTVLFALALYFEPLHLQVSHTVLTLHRLRQGAVLVLALTAVLVLALTLFRIRSEALISGASRRFRFLPGRLRAALGRLARAFSDGLDVIEDWRDLAASVASTVFLWVLNASVFWMTFRSLGGAVGQLSWWSTGFAMFFAALGLVLQLPGVGGGYQVGVILALREIFHVPPEGATSAAILTWVVILVPCVTLGVALLISDGLSFQKLSALADHETAVADKVVARPTG